MFWIYFAGSGPGALVKISGRINSTYYQEIKVFGRNVSARKLRRGRR